MEQNKTGKYLKYAIGEIVLVVIGILIALSINNWNEVRKNRDEEYRILMDLEREYLLNKESALEKLVLNKNSNKAAHNLMMLNAKGVLFEDLDLLDSLIADTMSYGSFDAHVGVTNEIISTGNISLLQDGALKSKLTGWSSELMNTQEDYKARMDYTILQLMPYLRRYFNLANQDSYIKWSHWNSDYNTLSIRSAFKPNMNLIPLEFENVLYTFKNLNDYVIIDEITLKEYIEETLILIKKNLVSKTKK